MLDLNKYTKFCQLAEKIDFLKGRCEQATVIPASYKAQLDRYKMQYDKLFAELSSQFDLPVNLKDYVHNLIGYLNAKTPDDEKWCYRYTELESKEIDYEYYIAHRYKYQVELTHGEKSYAVCDVNRELNYFKSDETINLLYDEMYAPFSLRLDETCEDFDEQTSMDLKKIYIQTHIQGRQAKVNNEMTLIQQEIARLQKVYLDKQAEYSDCDNELSKLDEQGMGLK